MASERRPHPLAPRRILIQTVLFLLGVGFIAGVQAQTSTVGSISGTVHDAQGAGVPHIEVQIQETKTGFSRTVKTDSDGFYSAPRLPLGTYSVTVAASGFKKAVHNEIE